MKYVCVWSLICMLLTVGVSLAQQQGVALNGADGGVGTGNRNGWNGEEAVVQRTNILRRLEQQAKLKRLLQLALQRAQYNGVRRFDEEQDDQQGDVNEQQLNGDSLTSENEDVGGNGGNGEDNENVLNGNEDVLTEDEDLRYNPWRDNFYDRFDDGTYVFGYSLPNGVRRYERSRYSEQLQGLVVEGFWSEPRYYLGRNVHELHCYRADFNGNHQRPLQFLNRPPVVQRGSVPNVNCFDV